METEYGLDLKYSADENLQHLMYFTKGYRYYVLGFANPFSRGSARDVSFEMGWHLAQQDRRTVTLLENDE